MRTGSKKASYEDGKLIPKNDVYGHIYRLMLRNSDNYDGDCVIRLGIRVYLEGSKSAASYSLSLKDRKSILSSIFEGFSEKMKNEMLPSFHCVSTENAVGLNVIRPRAHPLFGI